MFDHRDVDVGLFPGESDEEIYRLTVAEYESWVDEEVHSLPQDFDDQVPGPFLAMLLAFADRSRLTGFDLVRVVRARERLCSWAQADLYADIAEMARAIAPDTTRRSRHVLEFASEELQAALGRTRKSADIELGLAIDLCSRLPAVWEALHTGAIDVRRARVFSDETTTLDPETASVVVKRILPEAGDLTTGQLRSRLQKLCIQADPETAKRNLEAGLEERRFVTMPNPDLTAGVAIHQVDPEDAAAVAENVNRIAMSLKRLAGETRSMDQLRADVAIDLLKGLRGGQGSAISGGRRPAVHIRTSLETLLGLSEEPAEIPGHGPVLAEVARRIVAEGPDECVYEVADEATGRRHVVQGRRPTAAQERHVRSAYPTCVFPGCRMPSRGCDLDHRRRRSRGGETSCSNLAPLCRRHHRCKDEARWELERRSDGGHEWTSPLGHSYTTGVPP